MGLFGEAKICVHCGKKAGALGNMVLGHDNSCLCAKCADVIPEYMKEAAKESWSIEDYRSLLAWQERSAQELVPMFKESYSYHKLHVDEEHGLFYIEEGFLGLLNKKTPVMEMKYLYNAAFSYNPLTVKEGLLSTSVLGEVHMIFQMIYPQYIRNVVLSNEVKGKAKSSTFGGKVEYTEPEEVSDIETRFSQTAGKFMLVVELQEQMEQRAESITAAKGMFMIRPDERIEREKLDRQYERLLKSMEGEEDAIKHVNDSYNLLLEVMETEKTEA